ncbi:MAG: hypothetical protein AAFV53_18010, partial [Myxococcota bacterium]
SSMIEENGDFDDFGSEEFRGDAIDVDAEDAFEDFKWAYTIRTIDLNIPTDIGGSLGGLEENGYFGESSERTQDIGQNQMDLGDLGIQPDMITEYLGDYIREVRVLVWWGDNEDGIDQVELLTHVINPTGAVLEQGGNPNEVTQ